MYHGGTSIKNIRHASLLPPPDTHLSFWGRFADRAGGRKTHCSEWVLDFWLCWVSFLENGLKKRRPWNGDQSEGVCSKQVTKAPDSVWLPGASQLKRREEKTRSNWSLQWERHKQPELRGWGWGVARKWEIELLLKELGNVQPFPLSPAYICSSRPGLAWQLGMLLAFSMAWLLCSLPGVWHSRWS